MQLTRNININDAGCCRILPVQAAATATGFSEIGQWIAAEAMPSAMLSHHIAS